MVRSWLVILSLGALGCGSRTGLDPAGGLESAPPFRHLVVGSGRDACGYGVLETFRRRDGTPRALSYEHLDPCPPDEIERPTVVTDRYVAVLPDLSDLLEDRHMETVILDAQTLTEVRRGPDDLWGLGACAVSPSEIWVPADGMAVVDLDTGETTSTIQLPDGAGPGGCVSDGVRAYVCGGYDDDRSAIFPVRVSDRVLEDVDPATPGLQGYPVPLFPTYCRMALDQNHGWLYVEVDDYRPGTAIKERGIVGFDLEGSAEPKLLLSAERSHADRVFPLVLPDGELFVLLEKGPGIAWEWIRIDPTSGAIVSLRDFHPDIYLEEPASPAPWLRHADGALGDWVVTLAPKGLEGTQGEFDIEYFNAMTGETGPRMAIEDEESPEELHLLPSAP